MKKKWVEIDEELILPNVTDDLRRNMNERSAARDVVRVQGEINVWHKWLADHPEDFLKIQLVLAELNKYREIFEDIAFDPFDPYEKRNNKIPKEPKIH